jgi:hypothetical protein
MMMSRLPPAIGPTCILHLHRLHVLLLTSPRGYQPCWGQKHRELTAQDLCVVAPTNDMRPSCHRNLSWPCRVAAEVSLYLPHSILQSCLPMGEKGYWSSLLRVVDGGRRSSLRRLPAPPPTSFLHNPSLARIASPSPTPSHAERS